MEKFKEEFPDIEQEVIDYIEKNFVSLNEYKRSAADFENARKRIITSQEITQQRAKDAIFTEIAEFIDVFDIALKNTTDKDGIRMLRDKFITYLHKNAVTVEYPVDQMFDAERHEAVSAVSTGSEPGTIIDVIKPCIIRNDKVIRHANVIVEQ